MMKRTMYHRLLFMLLLLFTACNQIDVPEQEPRERTSTRTDDSDQPSSRSDSTNANRPKYREAYNKFQNQHDKVFEEIGGNKLALRNTGERSVEALEKMYSLLNSQSQSRLEDLRDSYIQAWSNFDIESPASGERNRLRRTGGRVEKAFAPSNVQLRTFAVNQNQSEGKDHATSTEGERIKGGIIVRESTDDNRISVDNPDRYRRLFQRWRGLHEKFQNGLEASDPLLQSTFQMLENNLKNMIEEVRSEKDKLSNYYLSQYRMIFNKRERIKGTPAKSDHLTFLKRQFIKDFAPSSSN